jgi:probable phosphoglycerate mutase
MTIMSTSSDSYRSTSGSAASGAAPRPAKSRIWLVRHGETDWSATGRHTGRSNLPLNEAGRRRSKELRSLLSGRRFELVLSSPLLRARETCRLAGYEEHAHLDVNLQEWNYG